MTKVFVKRTILFLQCIIISQSTNQISPHEVLIILYQLYQTLLSRFRNITGIASNGSRGSGNETS